MRLLMVTVLLLVNANFAFSQALTEGPGWKKNGREFLTYNGQLVTFDAQDLEKHRNRIRCVKMNNYGCVMGPDWQGGVGNDGVGHRVFEHPKWSVRAVVRDFCSKHKQNLRSALQIAEKYSPWCDTLGTKAVNNGWGRTCRGGPQPPASFNGPLCKKPANGISTAAQCAGCNCPDAIARRLVAGTSMQATDDLKLFGANGQPDGVQLSAVLKNHFRNEIGFTVAPELIVQGISLAGQCK